MGVKELRKKQRGVAGNYDDPQVYSILLHKFLYRIGCLLLDMNLIYAFHVAFEEEEERDRVSIFRVSCLGSFFYVFVTLKIGGKREDINIVICMLN